MQGQLTRRTALASAGVGGFSLLAGCPDNDDDDTDDTDDDVAVDGLDREDWEDVEEFYFEGRIEAWTGIEPGIIEGEDNPTIGLIEGQEYDFRWVNEDGVTHNMEIRDEDDGIIDDYQSEDVSDQGEEADIEGVVATEEMVTYICAYHESTQVGDIQVFTD
ncbi:cupredoxin domain-containing protein [Halovivax gelatinilyticus]|uniref:cupredoxin domain-containing protein n=1 Tax=Halovivax gelatinilyticus TaxID=2961597 RepID=UPI0020CA6606|nr:PKD domain-containing protein [Halovivax gelatinilyticus]